MIQELDTVVLMHDIAEKGLQKGDVGAVVFCGEKIYEVEFVSADGRTIAVLTLTGIDIRPVQGKEILHVRELA